MVTWPCCIWAWDRQSLVVGRKATHLMVAGKQKGPGTRHSPQGRTPSALLPESRPTSCALYHLPATQWLWSHQWGSTTRAS